MSIQQPNPNQYQDAKANAKAAKAYAKAQRPWFKKKRFIIPIFTVIIVAGLASTSGGSDEEPAEAAQTAQEDTAKGTDTPAPAKAAESKPAPVKKAAPKPVKVKAAAILKEFEENEAAADIKYDGKTLAVSGTIDKIDTEMFNSDEYVVRISDGSEYAIFTVNCDGQKAKDVATLKVGDPATVVGKFKDGGDLGIELSKCSVR